MFALTSLLLAACSSGSGSGGSAGADPCSAYCARYAQVCPDPVYTGTSGSSCQARCDDWSHVSTGENRDCTAALDAMHACLAAHPIDCGFGATIAAPGMQLDYDCKSEFSAWGSCVD